MKKILIILGSLIGLLLVAAIVIPLVVDVDKYRPQIVTAADQQLNGKLELGKLSLSLWGQIRIEIAGVQLTDSKGRKVLAVQDAFFHLPFSSILSGSPMLTLKMQSPEVNVTKDKTGMNILNLMKKDPNAVAAQPGAPAKADKSAAPSQPMELPGLARQARLGIELNHATVNYKDDTSGLVTKLNDLNIHVKDLSLSRPTELEIWADLDTTLTTQGSEPTTVKGPIRITAEAQPEVSGGKLEQMQAKLKVELGELEIRKGTLFEKKKGVVANLEGSFKSTPTEARIEQLDIRFHNAEIKVAGVVSNLAPAGGLQNGTESSPVVDMTIKSNLIALKPWTELVPMLKEYELGGSASFEANVKGPSDKLGYQAQLAVKELTAKSPKLKTQPQFDAVVKVTTDQIESFSMTMKAPGNDLRMNGKMISFTKPKLDLQIASSGMDLDQLIDFPPPAKKGESAKSAGKDAGEAKSEAANGKGAGAKEDFDAMLAPLRSNEMAAATVANIGIDMKMIKAYGVQMTDIHSKMSYRDLTAAIDSFGMNLWSAAIKMQASVAMKPAMPNYRFNASVVGLDMQKAVSSQMELFKNTVLGTASFSMDGAGASFNPDPAKVNLKAKGNLKVVNATFASIDVGKMTTDALNSAIGRVGDKVPAIKGKSIKGIPPGDTRYDLISSDFTIADGKFNAPNFVAKAAPGKGVDLNGSTAVGLKDYSLNARWQIIDTSNVTKAKDLSVDIAGTNVPHILAEGTGPIKFPITVGGTLFTPVYSYTEVPEYFVGVALKNIGNAATGRVKSEAKAQLQKQIQNATKNAPPAVQNALKGLFGH